MLRQAGRQSRKHKTSLYDANCKLFLQRVRRKAEIHISQGLIKSHFHLTRQRFWLSLSRTAKFMAASISLWYFLCPSNEWMSLMVSTREQEVLI